MLSLFTMRPAARRRLERRRLLQAGTALAPFSPLAPWHAAHAAAPAGAASARRCIYIFLCGGPSQLDMWDPKPDAPAQIRGPIQSIATATPGMRMGELLPQTARLSERLAVIRSMTHESNVHDIGILYTLLADSHPPSQTAFPPDRRDHPSLGALLRALLGDAGDLPAWVTVPRPFTTGARFYKGQTGGFLGPGYDPFFLDAEKRSSLREKSLQPTALQLPAELGPRRLDSRHRLLQQLNTGRPLPSPAAKRLEAHLEEAFSMLHSAGANGAFRLDREPAPTRERYGRNEYGQSFLLARRLVESGVRMVNVFWTFYGADGCQFNLWDNHGSDKPVCGGYNRGIDMIRAPYCCPAFDQAFSALLEDLEARGMLDDTLVVVTGEFGRTPKINQNAGRDHWAPCYSSVLAGGGVRGGQVYGASDKHAAYVQDSPVRPEDLGATILHAFGFAPETPVYDRSNRPVRVSKGRPIKQLFA